LACNVQRAGRLLLIEGAHQARYGGRGELPFVLEGALVLAPQRRPYTTGSIYRLVSRIGHRLKAHMLLSAQPYQIRQLAAVALYFGNAVTCARIDRLQQQVLINFVRNYDSDRIGAALFGIAQDLDRRAVW